MERTRYLVVGAGVTGLAFADWLRDDDYLIVEARNEIGGYCRTVERDGFVWDYSGHFFHFRDASIEQYLVERMDGQRVLRVERDSRIWYADRFIDFPFQRHIRQLPESEYTECVTGLQSRPDTEVSNFKEMLYARYGRGIAEKFLVPYNEKLYATNLARLDANAMGRFFPHVSAKAILDESDAERPDGYNVTFTYPERGAQQYVRALAKGVGADRISVNERVVEIDIGRKVAKTTKRMIRYDALVSSMPLPALLATSGATHDPGVYSHNKVLVFNLGFDRKGLEGVHWIYYPQRELSFYRVGFYDNIFGTNRMSLYVEVGLPCAAELGDDAGASMKARVLADLQTCGVVSGQSLVASHEVLLDPAYVHITADSTAEAARHRALLEHRDVHSIGRYGAWTYCSIEDNIVEARALAERLDPRS